MAHWARSLAAGWGLYSSTTSFDLSKTRSGYSEFGREACPSTVVFWGVLLALFLYARHINKDYWSTIDFIAPLVPFGLGAGRIGNFIGGELWGRPTDVAWGMVFPHVDKLPRHPSQLYEAALEGAVLIVLVWVFSSKQRPRFAVSGLFALGYGSFRFFIEFFREPDSHLGYLAFEWFTMGQLLSTPLILVGLWFLYLAYLRPVRPAVH